MNTVGGSFQWPPPKEEIEQGPTATPMYIDPQQPHVGSLYSEPVGASEQQPLGLAEKPIANHGPLPHVGSLHSEPAGASVRELLGLAEKQLPTHGPLAHSAPSPKPNQNGSAVPNYSVSLVTMLRIIYCK